MITRICPKGSEFFVFRPLSEKQKTVPFSSLRPGSNERSEWAVNR